jgi:pimeloyl-ACP methyl ester carboxylesterase
VSAAAPPIERWFDAAGVALRYVDAGAGEPVVLVHCYAGDFDTQFVASGFFAALCVDHRAIGMDMRGHGRSGKPHDPRQYGREMARDIVRLLDHLQLPRAHVVGYSMGAHVVAQLLTLEPDRVVSATLGGAAGRRNWTAADDARVEREADEMEQGSLHSQIVRLWPLGRPGPTEAQVRERSSRWLAGKDPLALAAVRRANRDQVITDAALAAVRVPVQGVVGADDPYLADFRQLAQVLPALELVVVEGAAHNTLASRPEFLQAVRRFVAAHPGAPAR